MSLLKLENLTLRFGGLTAVNGVSFTVNPNEIFAVIGPNGAGKTSLFNAVTGIYEPTSGRVLFEGKVLRRRFGARQVSGMLLVGVISFCASLVSVNIEPLWEAAIVNNYVYQEPFPWGKALGELQSGIAAILAGSGAVFPIACGILGVLGAALVWRRGRFAPEVVARGGISRTFQNIRLFDAMSVLENVLIGMDRNLKTNAVHSVFRLPLFCRERRASEKRAREILEFVELGEYESCRADSLPYGHQRRLEIARALASEPKLLLLDEPAAGTNPSEAVELTDLIRKIRDRGISVLLIEHHMKVVMGISDRIAVLDYGNKIAEGTPEEICSNPHVVAAYLGKPE